MENNEEQNIIDKANETKKIAEDTSKLAANLASGNFIGAAKNAFNLLKSKEFKKKLKRKIIMIALQCIIPIIIAVCVFSVLNAVKEKMVEFLSDIGNSISSFFSEIWKWITADYWIDLDEEKEYIDEETGETTSATIVDQYIYELDKLGISLESLRLLGDADYSDPAILEDENNKTLVEKYIAEFIRADVITQQPHKTDGLELVNSTNQNKIDGGIYFYRTKKEATISENEFENGKYNEENVAVTDKDFKQMEYIDYDDFEKELEKNNPSLRYKFTIDTNTGDLLMVKITTVVETTGTYGENEGVLDKLYNWILENTSKTTEYTLEEVRIPYKQYISKYTMPYEFLINLCTVTQNPEFVYHVALLARNTKIMLVAQDDTTIVRECEDIETSWKNYKNYENNKTSGAQSTDGKTERKRKVTTTTTQTPVLKIEYANTWSFYEEFEYTKNIAGEITQGNPKTDNLPIPDTLKHYEEPQTVSDVSEYAAAGQNPNANKIKEGYWWDSFPVKQVTTITTTTTTTTYNDSILKNSVEKSKQFLGLLRNSTGKCEYDCSEDTALKYSDPIAAKCAQNAEFDRYGIDVKYRIPNMTKRDAPLDNLLSGLDALYALLQSNSSGYNEEDKLLGNNEDIYKKQNEYIAEEDYESAYVVKMQGLVEHLQYLMTFPDEESYTIKDLILEYFFGDDYDNDDDYIPQYTWNGTTSELIEMLGKYAHQDMQESGILASVTVAQALVESGWGKSQLSATYNNYFGVKKGKGWDGPTVTLPTKEVINGQTITVKAEFRVYNSPLESLKNHSKVLSASRYSGIKGERDYRKAITIIKNGGYATDPNYVNTICKIIEQYGLTRFD